jgi:hypothetical protein
MLAWPLPSWTCWSCLPRQGILHFRFIIEYSSLRDFSRYIIGLFLYEDFWKMIFWLVLKLEISYRIIISWKFLVFFRRFFENYIFAWWNDALPCPEVNPLEGSPKCSYGKLGLGRCSQLSTLERGRGSSWEPRN